jgi:hypothetical protein
MTSAARFGNQRGSNGNLGRHRVTSTGSLLAHNTHHAYHVDRTALVDFVACPSPQHNARWTFVVVRLYTDAQEFFASTETHTHLSVRAQPFTTRNGTSCGYEESLHIGTPWSFFVCEWYKARVRA